MASSIKKKINQDDLRKLMKERRENLRYRDKKINSPDAKYNSIGQLYCVPCNLHVKCESLWPSHVLSKIHKQNVEISAKEHSLHKLETVHCNNVKRKADFLLPEMKKICTDSGKDDIVHAEESKQRSTTSASSVNQLSALQHYSSSEEESEGEGDLVAAVPPPPSTSVKNEITSGNLPPDFFDAQPMETSVPSSSSSQTPAFSEKLPSDKTKTKEKPSSGNNMESLPEGFFDDPVLDAKARNVEYKDPMEGEWEKFQKTIAEESNVSEAIIEEDVEESTVERDLDQIDQQIYNWSIIHKLQSKVEEIHVMKNDKGGVKSSDSSSEGEEGYEDFLNWRQKSV